MATANETQTERPYPEVPSKPSFPAIEEAVLASWEEAGTFQASVEGRPVGEGGANEFVFYDGPPFANGLPHHGHFLTGYVKDIVPRYQTMRGKRVERRFGWDCHGLPAEMGAEKELGISGRAKILDFGIQRFNDHCRGSVMKYADEWESYVRRIARWVDFKGDYKTMDLSYMESCIWAFKELWDKGLVYESYRVMPYSWAAETPVSNFETRLDDSYRERQDPAITVRFTLHAEDGPLDIWVWTTTPWTLPSNLALAVGDEIEYTVWQQDGRRFLLGSAAAAKYAKDLEGAEEVGKRFGKELVGLTYEPLFPYFAGHEGAFRVLSAEFVDTEEGTGVVHMAPGFGEDDQNVCEANGIQLVCPVDGSGNYTAEVTDWAGVNVLEANKPIIARLKDEGKLVRHDSYVHNYPHCWRTDTPLIYRAVSSWYVRVTDFRERMVELNQQINWIPGHIKDGQFGKWLANARDWSISRNRFWGAPIPIWKSDDPAYPRIDVYGSLDEIERDFGVRPADLHRPIIDDLTRPNPDDPTGKSTMRRVEEVFDCWFESGSMPYAQAHYPFENKEWFENHFPADFIVEYVSQTRGWFYTMMILSTALFDRPPFKNCICHGVVLGNDGRKLSKRLKNYPDPKDVLDTHGSDALRWYLCTSTVLRGGDIPVEMDAIGEAVRLVVNPIWNAYSFFCLYANADGIRAERRTDQAGVLDRYALAKTRELVERVQAAMDEYDLARAGGEVRSFLDALNNWYIRRSRPRFWKAERDQDKQDAYDTLYTVLETLCRVCAPFLPLITEEVWRGLTGGESVHLADWPDATELPADPDLVQHMDRVRQISSATLGLREEARLRVRLPLATLTLAGPDLDGLEPYLELIADEVNVKRVETTADLSRFGRFDLKLNARTLGPKVGREMKSLLAAARAGDWSTGEDGSVRVQERVLEEDEYELRFLPDESLAGLAVAALPTNDAAVALDTEPTPELLQEGVARDVVRQIQIARKEAGLAVSDSIDLRVEASSEVGAAVEAHRDYVAEQTLAARVSVGAAEGAAFVHAAELGGEPLAIGVTRQG